MPSYQPFLISGFKTAKSIGMEPWLSPPDAFPKLENMRVNKGVLEKRLGFSPFAQMKHGSVAQTTTAITGIKTYLKNGMPSLLIMDSKGSAGSYTGRCNLYNPVDATMTDISSDLANLADIFHGSPSDFFHFCNWQGVGYMVNNVDQIHKWEGRGNAVVPFNIQINTTDEKTNHIDTCRYIFIKDDRILLLDTVEFGDWCSQRLRYSPVLQTDFSAAGGGYVDAPTQHRIVTAGYVGKNIAVYMQGGTEGSLWLIKSTGNSDIPFKWDRITDTEVVRSPYSGVEIKDGLVAVSTTNIIFYDGFKIKDLDIPHIRDFFKEFNDAYVRFVLGYNQKEVRHLLFTFKAELTAAEIVILDSYDANSNDVIEESELVSALSAYHSGTLPIKLYLILVESYAAGILTWNFPYTDRILDYNIMENNWTIHRSTQTFFINCLGGFTDQKVPSMSELDDVVSSDGALVSAMTVDSRAVLGTPKPFTLIGCRNSRVYKWDDGEYDGTNNSSGEISILAPSINFNPYVKKGLKVACEKIGFLVDNDSAASFLVSLYKNTGLVAYKTKTISCDGSNDKFWAWIFCDGEIGDFHRLEITHTERGNTPRIHAFMPFFAPAGRLDG